MTSFKTTLLILTITTIQVLANRAAALPTVSDMGQFTDRFLPILDNPVIPPGDNLQIYAYLESADAPGSPSIAVSAKQGVKTVTLNRFQIPDGPDNFYWGFVDFDPSLTGAWEIIPTDSTGTGPSAFTDALAEPELVPYVDSITPKGSPLGASVEWTLPDLTGFDVEFVAVRIVQVTPRSPVFFTDFPFPATSFEPPPGVLEYGVEYVYNIELHDVGPFTTENRSVAQSQRFRFALPGDFNTDGTVDAADYVYWRKNFSGDQTKYDAWRTNFGTSLGVGSSGATGSASASADPLSTPVPEPTSFGLLLLSIVSILVIPHRRRVARFRC
jgi:hypothetical protein